MRSTLQALTCLLVVALPAVSKHVSWFPPTAREAWWPVLIGLMAVGAGIWAVNAAVNASSRPAVTVFSFLVRAARDACRRRPLSTMSGERPGRGR